MIEAAEADLELDPAAASGRCAATRRPRWAGRRSPGGPGPDGLAADVEFKPAQPTFPFGAHVAVVEVDTETGKATWLRHVTVDDAGRVLNPVLAEGQRHGGIAQGVAQALLEEVRYDAGRQPADQHAGRLRRDHCDRAAVVRAGSSETPTTVNPLGVKGIGEAGTIGVTPAVLNAVIDAVVPPRRPAHRHASHAAPGVGRDHEARAPVKVTMTVNGAEVAADVEDRAAARCTSCVRRPG